MSIQRMDQGGIPLLALEDGLVDASPDQRRTLISLVDGLGLGATHTPDHVPEEVEVQGDASTSDVTWWCWDCNANIGPGGQPYGYVEVRSPYSFIQPL